MFLLQPRVAAASLFGSEVWRRGGDRSLVVEH